MKINDLLSGAATSEDDRPRRVPSDVMERWSADTIQAARVPAGIRASFVGDARAVEIDVQTASTLALATPTAHGEFTVYVDGRRHSGIPVAAETTETVHIDLPDRAPDAPVEIHLPERYEPRLLDVRAIDGQVQPRSSSVRWVAYGDSITQGWTTSDPGATWTATAARSTGFDLLNLGFAGAARGELPLAAHLASTPADVISLAWGTNCWSQIEMDAAYIKELMRLFLTMVRRGHRDTPLLVMSPVLRPAAEATANGSGATLADLRDALEEAVVSFQRVHADENLHLLRGEGLISLDQLDPDGIHPNDAGHAAISTTVGATLKGIID